MANPIDRRKFLQGLLATSAAVKVIPPIDLAKVITSTTDFDTKMLIVDPWERYSQYSAIINWPYEDAEAKFVNLFSGEVGEYLGIKFLPGEVER